MIKKRSKIPRLQPSFFSVQIVDSVFRGDGINFWRHAKLRKLMEEENCRSLIISRLNRGIARRSGPDDHVEDVVRKGAEKRT